MSGWKLVWSLAVTLAPGAIAAQVIAVRTVPVPRDHQFDRFPSLSAAMGGVSVAAEDSLLDPFRNPARGNRVTGARIFAAAGYYRVQGATGNGTTLPLGVIGRAGAWFGGLAYAMQDVDVDDGFGLQPATPCPACVARGITLSEPAPPRGNDYFTGFLGRRFPEAGMAVGVGIAASDLTWVHGTELLYAGSARVQQRGDGLDLRLGATKEWGPRTLDAVLVHNRYSGSHDVVFIDRIWDPGATRTILRPRLEANLDRTNTWGAHVQYRQPLRARGWQIGAVATVNALSHPKIPNYVIQNIPRDPGNSTAFNFGVGLWKRTALSEVAMEVLVEPIRSHTWGEADSARSTAAGGLIPAGGKTVDNRFRFGNTIVRLGAAQRFPFGAHSDALTFRVGLGAHRIRYELEQSDLVAGTWRRADHGWTEWTPTWGVSFRVDGVELHYRGRASGTDLGAMFAFGGGDDVTITEPGPGVVAAPAGPLSMDRLRVTTHQFSISIPIR